VLFHAHRNPLFSTGEISDSTCEKGIPFERQCDDLTNIGDLSRAKLRNIRKASVVVKSKLIGQSFRCYLDNLGAFLLTCVIVATTLATNRRTGLAKTADFYARQTIPTCRFP